jgi:hypothetical protein
MPKTRGFVFYDGPSMLDGAPIIGIAVYRSSNVKTGDMVQTYILRADVDPVSALMSGADESICGDCVHRPIKGGACYVDVAKSVRSVYSAWCKGAYPLMSPTDGARTIVGRALRIGSYGDPAAIPAEHWQALRAHTIGHTGYTHQWRRAHTQALRSIVMASADSASDRDTARAMGWRTFRVRTSTEALGAREIVCPASPEGGDRRQCITCRACDGAPRGVGQASIAIIVHGAKARRFVPIVAA